VKIAKQDLKRIIVEEICQLTEVEPDPTKLGAQSVGTSQRRRSALGRISDTDKEFSSMEKGLVDQIEAYVSKLAALPGVDLVQHRALLTRVLKTLESAVGKKHREQPKTQGDKQ
tara:strand:- start:74 stop:415 length:342 start_codon:yes stop_codon:yes gene_type:complete